MALVDVLNRKAEKVSQVELPDTIFSIPVKSNVLHEVVTMQLANRRAGSASVKHRSDVKGSGRKLYRQKGTGRARRGDVKSPLLRGGGSVFGPDPRSYSYNVPKKVKRLGLKMALSSKLKEDNLVVLDELDLDRIKTKEFLEVMEALNTLNALIVTEKTNEHLVLSSRNVPGIKVLKVEGMNVYDILKHKNVVLLESSLKSIEGRLLG
ncbi:MAG: 50S ribosomal protein L4 [Deltaproteobacteria bacterium]|jgi:large subunit ribosomal protein L4|nr:50S ribosomal protein L4 [Deltaproteobacteria bacterium]MDX2498218.1 50S ribosomal protein L4 [Desulfobacterales bacterium]MBW1747262.1 50S ribosomal protein L4 [Deltaproteobacteria bacterium]MBW1825871.1 50S ribosomal protein L4 [Deltaproteobacteria bacterium]MBW1968667.1 50S ribosomal protein L4 [Deltaproteobacteria bacterium]